jgi:AraC-like DNA-binding protein
VTKVRDRLADDAAETPTLAELASLAGLSRYQVLRRFEKVYGVPPHAWLLQRRAERARGLIRGGAGLAAAAAACGFADQSHMTRVFVRQFGFTPGAWQKAAARRPQ